MNFESQLWQYFKVIWEPFQNKSLSLFRLADLDSFEGCASGSSWLTFRIITNVNPSIWRLCPGRAWWSRRKHSPRPRRGSFRIWTQESWSVCGNWPAEAAEDPAFANSELKQHIPTWVILLFHSFSLALVFSQLLGWVSSEIAHTQAWWRQPVLLREQLRISWKPLRVIGVLKCCQDRTIWVETPSLY